MRVRQKFLWMSCMIIFVLDFAVAFVQTNYHPETIPDIKTASDDAMFNYAASVCPPSEFMKWWWSYSVLCQAAKELGYYSYDIEPFKDWLTIKSGSDVLRKSICRLGARSNLIAHSTTSCTDFTTTKSKIMFHLMEPRMSGLQQTF